MITIELRLLTGRYHATPWGRHVNEGVAEWPPSPYRLIRALYDVWKRKCDHFSEAEVAGVFEALAAEAPTFHAPQVVSSHTRSYLHANELDPQDKNLVFDGFVATQPEHCCYLVFPGDLGAREREILSRLLGELNFLGRSESWVKARLDGEPKGAQVIAPGDAAGPGQDVVRVACAEPLKTGRDQEWMQELAYSTAKMFKEKRSSPPALRRVSYVQSRDAVVNWVPALAKKKPQEIRAFELSLSSPVLPLATETVRFAEKIRNAWLSCCKTIGGASRWVAGKDESGEPLRGAHEHVFLLPQPDSLGRIRKVLVFAKQLEQRDVDGLLSLREVRQFEERPIRVAVTWMGEAEKAPFFREVDEVISLTPYAPVRHWRKGRGEAQDFARIDAVQECIRHGLITPDLASAVQVEKVERMEGPFHQALYRMSRKREEPRRLGVALRIKFPKKVRTPFSLGYGCHFGLGQFRPVSDDPAR